MCSIITTTVMGERINLMLCKVWKRRINDFWSFSFDKHELQETVTTISIIIYALRPDILSFFLCLFSFTLSHTLFLFLFLPISHTHTFSHPSLTHLKYLSFSHSPTYTQFPPPKHYALSHSLSLFFFLSHTHTHISH